MLHATAIPFRKNDVPIIAQIVIAIDNNNIIKNYRICEKRMNAISAKPSTLGAVVKADAYGLGIRHAMPALIAAGCEYFWVATPEEAIELQTHHPVQTIVLSGTDDPEVLNHPMLKHCHFVVNSPRQFHAWKHARAGKRPFVHIDTGLNRLGFSRDEWKVYASDILQLKPQFMMTHLSCGDENNHPETERQINAFQAALALTSSESCPPLSIRASGGLFQHGDPRIHTLCQMPRIGRALYGLAPLDGTDNPMQPVASVYARIVQCRNVKKGDSVGYGCSWVAEKDTALAIVAIGYADGFMRQGSNRAHIFVNGTSCPVRGRISMDLIAVDVSHIPQGILDAQEWAEIIGPHQSPDMLADAFGTMGRHVLTALSQRAARLSYSPNGGTSKAGGHYG